MSLDVQGEVFRTYAFYASILVIKMVGLSFLTSRQRFKKQAFANPEDIADKKGLKVTQADPDVERVRRAHLNDLENILPFLIIGLLYTITNPSVVAAGLLFKIYTAARFSHSFVYAVYPIRQPARALSFGIGVLVQVYMAVRVVLYFY